MDDDDDPGIHFHHLDSYEWNRMILAMNHLLENVVVVVVAVVENAIDTVGTSNGIMSYRPPCN